MRRDSLTSGRCAALFLLLLAGNLVVACSARAPRSRAETGETSAAAETTASVTLSNRLPADPRDFRSIANASNFGKDKLDVVKNRYGISLDVPPTAAGGAYEGVFVGPASSDGYGEGFVVAYTNDVRISVTHWKTGKDARTYLGTFTSDLPSSYAPYVTRGNIGGHGAYLIHAFSIPPVLLSEIDTATGLGKIAPGTGIGLSQSGVAWVQGRYAISVLSSTHTAEELVPVASAFRVQPRAQESDEDRGFWRE